MSLLPTMAAAAKKTTGTFRPLVLGDSIGNGVGPISTGNGSDGKSYGGATPSAGNTLFDDGVLQATYQDSGAGTGTDPGYTPFIGEGALTAGFSAVEVYRWAVNGSTTRTGWQDALEYATGDALVKGFGSYDLCVIPLATNDANNAGEAAAFALLLPFLYRDIEQRWPGCRIFHMQMPSTSSKSETAVVNGHIVTHTSARGTRGYVTGVGTTLSDTIHPDLDGYKFGGELIIPGYLALG